MSSEQKIRLFVALDLPEVNDAHEPIGYSDVQLYLKNTFPDFRPTPKVHITIAFIGAVVQSAVASIKSAITVAIQEFLIKEKEGVANGISGLMIAPGAHILGKNAIALRLIENHQLLRLSLYVQAALTDAGIAFDATKHEQLAHLTLGRIPLDAVDPILLERILSQLQAPLGARAQAQESFTAQAVTLYQSLPGSTYIPLQSYRV